MKEDSEMDNHVNNAREVIFLDPVCSHNIWGGSRLGKLSEIDPSEYPALLADAEVL